MKLQSRSVLSSYRFVLATILGVGLSGACQSPSPSRAPQAPPPPAELQSSQSILQAGFQQDVVFSSLTAPTVIQFASDGRVFIAEKSGRILVFDSLSDTTPDVFADLSPKVHNFWDRGLLGMALHPQFPTQPYVYVLYTHDALPGGVSPRWGDDCPSPPGATQNGCVVTGRLSRLRALGNAMTGTEEVLIEGFGQQFPSHSVGGLAFGVDGALYATMGDGASFDTNDWGQFGIPLNPLGDPPGGVGAALNATTSSGGAFRSQSLRRPAGQPVLLNGTLIRVSPATGSGLTDNPLATNPDANAARIVAYGLRNPFRMAIRPGTNEVWVADVGGAGWEELNRVAVPNDAVIENFGWPCFEGPLPHDGYQGLNNHHCTSLPATAVTTPFFSYPRLGAAFAGDTCRFGGASISGLAFYGGNRYPQAYNGALFLADYTRRCIWVMRAGANGVPDPSQIFTFNNDAGFPVDLKAGPDGDIYYADIWNGRIHRIRYAPPQAVASANVTSGPAPLAVQFDGSTSTPGAGGGALTYAWDLNGDGVYSEGNMPQASFNYTSPGRYVVHLRVTNGQGISSLSPDLVIQVGPPNAPPVPVIETPTSTTRWIVGDTIVFRGTANDPESGALPGTSLTWTLIMQHCGDECHVHVIRTFEGVATGSFVTSEHEYPSHLELVLTATDAQGLQASTSVELHPRTSQITLQASPQTTPGLPMGLNDKRGPSPFTRSVIIGSNNVVTALATSTLGDVAYDFVSWSDGGAASHVVTSTATDTTLTARYAARRLIPGTGLLGTYAQASTGASVTRLDPVVDFTWGAGAPIAGIGADNFTVGWSGTVVPRFTETVTFTTVSDDGVRLWIDDTLVINNWTDHAAVRNSGSIALVAGREHRIRLEYYERAGSATARLLWSSPSFAEEVVPTARLYPPSGLRGEYFPNRTLTAPSVLTRTDATVNFEWGAGSPASGIAVDNFSVRWTGKLRARTAETVTLSTRSDDGVRLWLDGQLIIDNWTDHGPVWNRIAVPLQTGRDYDIRMEYYERSGGAVAKLFWSSPSFAEEAIPASQLTP